MSTPLPLPDDLWGLLGLLLIVAVPAVTTVVVTRIQSARADSKHAKLARDVGEVKEQVCNTHPPEQNMRDDLDRQAAKLDQVDTKVDRLTGSVEAQNEQMRAFMSEVRKVNAQLLTTTAACPNHAKGA